MSDLINDDLIYPPRRSRSGSRTTVTSTSDRRRRRQWLRRREGPGRRHGGEKQFFKSLKLVALAAWSFKRLTPLSTQGCSACTGQGWEALFWLWVLGCGHKPGEISIFSFTFSNLEPSWILKLKFSGSLLALQPSPGQVGIYFAGIKHRLGRGQLMIDFVCVEEKTVVLYTLQILYRLYLNFHRNL